MKIYSNEDEQSIKILKVIGYLVFKYIKTKYINLAEQKKAIASLPFFYLALKNFKNCRLCDFIRLCNFIEVR